MNKKRQTTNITYDNLLYIIYFLCCFSVWNIRFWQTKAYSL